MRRRRGPHRPSGWRRRRRRPACPRTRQSPASGRFRRPPPATEARTLLSCQSAAARGEPFRAGWRVDDGGGTGLGVGQGRTPSRSSRSNKARSSSNRTPTTPTASSCNMLPADGIELTPALTIGISTEKGIYFGGADGQSMQSALDAHVDLDATIPVNRSLGPVSVPSAHLRLIAVRRNHGGGSLGDPASRHRAGARADRSRRAWRCSSTSRAVARLQPRSISRPASSRLSGVGLSVDAGGIVERRRVPVPRRSSRPVRGRAAAVVAGQLTLKAFGLIATRMPDGSRGYSLIVFITAEGFRPIPLGLGFTLPRHRRHGGVNRTFDQNVLCAGLAARTRWRRCCSRATRWATPPR